MEATSRVREALMLLKEPFLQFPEKELSLDEAHLMSGVDRQLCGIVLNALVDVRFLQHGPDGAYRLAGSSAWDQGSGRAEPAACSLNL
jgi:hypothetical protein